MIIKWPRRLLLDKLKRRAKLIYPPTTTPSVIQLTSHTMLKKGPHNILNEAEAMRFIRARTNIPVPDVLDTWAINEDYAYLVMERVEGVPLRDVFQKLSPAQKRTIAHELKAFVDQMRAIVVPQSHNPGTTGIASVKGGTFREDRFDDEYMGPFEDERAYHDWRVSVVQAFYQPTMENQPTMERLKIIRKELQDDHDIVFTHGDLNPGNILIKVLGDGDAHIVAVLDWEMAGWRPAYWEYVKCLHCMGGCDTEWGEFVGMVLQKYEKEKALDDELQQLSGAGW
ncbi:hypothetical protein M378DRAFT_77523 [Amanita muscaria Koide BX008]|uniref:Aminoglycoside phosphotransferase domain-containing protein n=1 Tax=Amanita muscaria (strain Koide BX008) TaxID=946122 RepID=A0A0C2SP12_AMAMK|nr:hypothetical protein M378DRAFT_77523 [Amanita muscaria Koide BX008]